MANASVDLWCTSLLSEHGRRIGSRSVARRPSIFHWLGSSLGDVLQSQVQQFDRCHHMNLPVAVRDCAQLSSVRVAYSQTPLTAQIKSLVVQNARLQGVPTVPHLPCRI